MFRRIKSRFLKQRLGYSMIVIGATWLHVRENFVQSQTHSSAKSFIVSPTGSVPQPEFCCSRIEKYAVYRDAKRYVGRTKAIGVVDRCNLIGRFGWVRQLKLVPLRTNGIRISGVGKSSHFVIGNAVVCNVSPAVIIDGDVAYAFGGRQTAGSAAVQVGGEGDVTQSHVRWTSQTSSYVSTPVLVAGKFYWIDDRGIYYCMDASTGKQLVRSRGPDLGGGRPVYASPIAINNKIYIQSRKAGLLVLDTKEEITVLAHNRFASDSSQFNATPAVDQGQLFLRSDEYHYCIQQHPSEL